MARLSRSILAPLAVAIAWTSAGCRDDAPPDRHEPTSTDHTSPTPPPSAQLPPGQRLYLANCAMCHGTTGRGDGPIAPHLPNPPRGLVSEPWQTFPASTSDEVRAGIARVIQTGLIERGMPAVGAAWPQSDLNAVVDYVLTLRAGTNGP